MAAHNQFRTFLIFLIGFLILIISYLMTNSAVQAQETEGYCLSCHNNPDLKMTFPNGETLSLNVSPEMLQHSIHSQQGIECEACHTNIKSYPHPQIDYQNPRELSLAYYASCKKCHSINYDKAHDSIHAKALEAGNLNAPVCTDCHGAHDVRSPNKPRTTISETCRKCHSKIYDEYKSSIHGNALINEENEDVPVCTNCHGVHNIQDPRTAQFRIETPELCAGCHADQELMSKYGLPSDVYNIYKLSWHGMDVAVYKAKWPTIWHESAVCTDCHGVHNILPADNPASSVNPKNLLSTCQKCHPDAGPNWTGAWTGHQKISLERTPYLFYTDLFYSYFAPAVLWMSVIYVILQIIHATVDRFRRNM